MELWHLTPETPRTPFHVSAGEIVELGLGTYPIAPGQTTWVAWDVLHTDGRREAGRTPGAWQHNDTVNSYWAARLGPWQDGDQVEYTVMGSSPEGAAQGPRCHFTVGPKLYLALLWQQHQPLYRNLRARRAKGAYACPWVRLRALRDYYVMAARLEPYPEVHVTLNLTPVLLWQIDDYLRRGATDRALDLTLTPTRRLSLAQREELLARFFEASWHTQILPFPRYRALFAQRQAGEAFALQDLTDLQMWFNLAWFAPEFQDGEVALPDGSVASVRQFIERGADFTSEHVQAMVAEQWKILHNIVGIHRRLQERGQIEVCTTPFAHPLLPLLDDTDLASPGHDEPTRLRHAQPPDDVRAQIQQAVTLYREHFGQAPQGMRPAAGAVTPLAVPLLYDAGVRWLASDQAMFVRTGQPGPGDAQASGLGQTYGMRDETGRVLSLFFQDSSLAHRLRTEYSQYSDYTPAATDFLNAVKAHAATSQDDPRNRIISVILDGDSPWGAYSDQGRAFLTALYQTLSCDTAIRTVTFTEYLTGNPARGVSAHPPAEQPGCAGVAHASRTEAPAADADRSPWIATPAAQRAWELVQQARTFLRQRRATPESHPAAFASLCAAEGSDWLGWLGETRSADRDAVLDDLFRLHLQNVYRALRRQPPGSLKQPLVPTAPVWTCVDPIEAIDAGERLAIRTNCPGVLHWGVNQEALSHTAALTADSAGMAGVNRHSVTLGPFGADIRQIVFRFECRAPACPGTDVCSQHAPQHVQVRSAPSVQHRTCPLGP